MFFLSTTLNILNLRIYFILLVHFIVFIFILFCFLRQSDYLKSRHAFIAEFGVGAKCFITHRVQLDVLLCLVIRVHIVKTETY